jgi:hypothetical protein
MTSPLAAVLPANDGYVAAAYIVFVVLLLIYLSIMAVKLSRLEKDTGELLRLAQERDALPAEAEPAVTSRDLTGAA